jgi:hypothetical protein
MSCEQLENLSLLIDGELESRDAHALELHISTCSECHQAHMDFLALRSQMTSYAFPFTRTLKPELARLVEPAREVRFRSASAPRFAWSSPGLAAMTVIVLSTVTVGTLSFMLTSTQPAPSSSDVAQAPKSASAQPSPTSDSTESDEMAIVKDRRRSKVKPKQTQKPKTDSREKQNRERSAPRTTPVPQRSVAPPTYARLFEDDMEVTKQPDGGIDMLRHLQQSELLLRTFRNIGHDARKGEVGYERKRASHLVYQNILLRREAETSGDVQVATLLGSLEPILLDIANLRDQTNQEAIRAIQDRMERQSLVALIQINSAAVARANE